MITKFKKYEYSFLDESLKKLINNLNSKLGATDAKYNLIENYILNT